MVPPPVTASATPLIPSRLPGPPGDLRRLDENTVQLVPACKATMAGSGANRRGPGHHERSGPNQDHDDVLRAGPDLFRPQSRLPDRGRLHCSPRRANPARLLHLALRVLGLDHRQPGHGESVLPQHVGPRRGTSVYAALGIILSSNGKPADHTSIENPTGNPGGLFGYATAWLEYQQRPNPIAAAAFTGPHPELVTNTN